MSNDIVWDVFISHASEDKKRVAAPLAKALEKLGLDVWLDKDQIELGDNLRQKIEDGLSKCRFGVIVISPNFLKKEWTAKELDAFISRDLKGRKVILPIWHECSEEFIADNFPLMHGKLAISTEAGISEIAKRINAVVKNSPIEIRNEPDLINIHFEEQFTSIELSYEIRARKSDTINLDAKKMVFDTIHPYIERIAGSIFGKEVKINGKAKWDTDFYSNPPDSQGRLVGEISARSFGFTPEGEIKSLPISFAISLEDSWEFSYSIFTQNTFRIYFAHMGMAEDEGRFFENYTLETVAGIFSEIETDLREVIAALIKDDAIDVEIGKVRIEEGSFPVIGSTSYTSFGIVTAKKRG